MATSGGIIQTFLSESINYKSHTFTSSGIFEYTGSGTGSIGVGSLIASILVVGGGGGGALGRAGDSNTYSAGNGGAAGGLIYSASFQISPTTGSFLSGSSLSGSFTGSRGRWNIIIGNGGNGGTLEIAPTNGEASYLYSGSLSLTASYGAHGGFNDKTNPGASGGGSHPTGSAAIFGDQGKDGGDQTGKSGAGGGGASSEGSNSYAESDPFFTTWIGGAGGAGKSFTLRAGSLESYSGGGGGGGNVNYGLGAGGAGGSSVGGNGGSRARGKGADGIANTGAGGGGGALSEQPSNWGTGGNGATGVVIITYNTSSFI